MTSLTGRNSASARHSVRPYRRYEIHVVGTDPVMKFNAEPILDRLDPRLAAADEDGPLEVHEVVLRAIPGGRHRPVFGRIELDSRSRSRMFSAV